MRHLATCLIGLIFGVGISMAWIANPAAVLNFREVADTWDPSRGFVTGGAVIVGFVGSLLVLRRERPVDGPVFDFPTNRLIDAKPVGGSAVFGIGRGIAGFCPGGGVARTWNA